MSRARCGASRRGSRAGLERSRAAARLISSLWFSLGFARAEKREDTAARVFQRETFDGVATAAELNGELEHVLLSPLERTHAALRLQREDLLGQSGLRQFFFQRKKKHKRFSRFEILRFAARA